MLSSRRSASVSSDVGPTPRSEAISVASKSSQVSESIRSTLSSSPSARASTLLLEAKRRRSRANRERGSSGWSSMGSVGSGSGSSETGGSSSATGVSSPATGEASSSVGVSCGASMASRGSPGGSSFLPYLMMSVAATRDSPTTATTIQKITSATGPILEAWSCVPGEAASARWDGHTALA